MKALVVYESIYGNTAAIGEAIAASLRAQGLQADARPVSRVLATDVAGVELLVVGGPTHAHGMSRASTRKVGADDDKNTFAEPTLAPGLREWLDGLSPGAGGFAAAFDTRLDRSLVLTGSAAKGIGRRLEHQGFQLVVEPESFFVTVENQLMPGATEHAATWGRSVAEHATETIPG